jgi:hypothetical protein
MTIPGGFERAVQNLGAAVYGEEPWRMRQAFAEKAVKLLVNWSLLKLEKGDDENIWITVHDLLEDVAVPLVREGLPHLEEVFEGDMLRMPRPSVHGKHVLLFSRQIPIGLFMTSKYQSYVIDNRRDVLVQHLRKERSAYECRFLSIYGGKLLGLEMFKHLQCLRLVACDLIGMIGVDDEVAIDNLQGFQYMTDLQILEMRSSVGGGEQRLF